MRTIEHRNNTKYKGTKQIIYAYSGVFRNFLWIKIIFQTQTRTRLDLCQLSLPQYYTVKGIQFITIHKKTVLFEAIIN